MLVVDLKNGTNIEVHTKNGFLKKLILRMENGEMRAYLPEEESYIKMWLQKIMKVDIDKFKQILTEIKKDERFFEFGDNMRRLEIRDINKQIAKTKEDYEKIIKSLQERKKKLEY